MFRKNQTIFTRNIIISKLIYLYKISDMLTGSFVVLTFECLIIQNQDSPFFQTSKKVKTQSISGIFDKLMIELGENLNKN